MSAVLRERAPPRRRSAIFLSCTDAAKQLRMATNIPVWRLAIAGGLAGMFTNAALHPLDTVKTVRQANPATFRGVIPTFVALVRTRGFFSLYAGITPALVGSALSSALYFSAYEAAKHAFAVSTRALQTRVTFTALSAACGNIASSVLFVPKEVVKQRMQSAVDGAHFFTVASNLVRTSGARGLYRGYKATLLRNIPSTMLRFAIYEEVKILLRNMRARNDSSTGRKSTASDMNGELILAGAIAGAIASTLTTPMDVLKTRFATGAFPPQTSLPTAFRSIVREHGLPGLFVGVRPRAIWAALFAAIGFSSYEMCKRWMIRFPTPVRDTQQFKVSNKR